MPRLRRDGSSSGHSTRTCASLPGAVVRAPAGLGVLAREFGSGAQPAVTATWQFWVGASSATSPVDTNSGAILDVNGDGYANRC
jgi:hypothetical protein